MEHSEGGMAGEPTDKEYEAVVVSVDDPMKLGRIRARIAEKFEGIPDNHLPWARPKLSHASGATLDYGSFEVPEVGSKVFLKFQGGSLSHPFYTGFSIDNQTALPESKHNYPKRKVHLLKSGAIVVIDEQSKEIFIRNPGELNVYIQGNVSMQVDGNVAQRIKGDRLTYIDGSDTLVVKGYMQTHVEGNSLEKVSGTLEKSSTGNMTLTTSSEFVASSSSSMTVVSGASFTAGGSSSTTIASGGVTKVSGAVTGVYSGAALALGGTAGIDFQDLSGQASAPSTVSANSDPTPAAPEAPEWPEIRGPKPE